MVVLACARRRERSALRPPIWRALNSSLTALTPKALVGRPIPSLADRPASAAIPTPLPPPLRSPLSHGSSPRGLLFVRFVLRYGHRPLHEASAHAGLVGCFPSQPRPPLSADARVAGWGTRKWGISCGACRPHRHIPHCHRRCSGRGAHMTTNPMMYLVHRPITRLNLC